MKGHIMKTKQNRRDFLQKVGIGAGALLIGNTLLAKESSPKAQSPSAQKFREEKLNLSTKWDKTFPKSPMVLHQKVTFHNRYGITLAADLYLPKNPSKVQFHKDSKLPAIALSGPFGAVKEQSSGLYAQTLAENGFITLALQVRVVGFHALSLRLI